MIEQPFSPLLDLGVSSLSDGSLLLSLHPDGSRLAAARGPSLCVCPLRPPAVPSATSRTGPQAPASASAAREAEERARLRLEEQALHERQATHGSAGPHSAPPDGINRHGDTSRVTLRSRPALRFSCRAPSTPPAVSPDDITALAWLAFARPPAASGPISPRRAAGSGGGAAAAAAEAGSVREAWSGSGRRRTDSSGAGGGIFASIQVMLEDQEELQRPVSGGGSSVPAGPHARFPGPLRHPGYSTVVLLSGTRGGALQLHDAESGAVLLRQQLHPGPVLGITVRTWRIGLKPDDAVEDVTMAWGDAVVRLAAWELRTAATSCYAAAAAAAEAKARGGGGGQSRFGLWGASAPAGPDVKPLAFQKWEVPSALRGRTCVVCCGQRPRSLYALLQGLGSNSSSSSSWSVPTPTGKTVFLAGGDRPASLAALQVDEQGTGGGALSYITSVATSVSSGVMGLARTAHSVAAAPLAVGAGLRSFLLNPLQLGASAAGASPSKPAGTAKGSLTKAGRGAGAGGAGATAECSSASAQAQQPLVSFEDNAGGQRPPSTGTWRQFRDDGRLVVALAPAPHGSLVAAVDGLGRVMLVEVGAMVVSRMWKGYRDAQVAWLEIPISRVLRLQQRQGTCRPAAQHPATLPTQLAHATAAKPPAGPGIASIAAAAPGASDACTINPQGAAIDGFPSDDGHGNDNGVVSDSSYSSYALLLVMYAPRRRSLELWWPLQGGRLAAVTVPTRGSLLQRGGGGAAGAELGTWRVADVASAASPPLTPAGCMMGFVGRAPSLGEEEDGDAGEQQQGFGDAGKTDGGQPGKTQRRRDQGLELVDVAAVFGLL